MGQTKANEGAFAAIGGNAVDIYDQPGLTKREYFAAMAMSGVLVRDTTVTPTLAAEISVKYADALIEALNKTKEQE